MTGLIDDVLRVVEKRLGRRAARHVARFVEKLVDPQIGADSIVEVLTTRDALFAVADLSFVEIASDVVDLDNDTMLTMRAFSAGDDIVVIAATFGETLRQRRLVALYISR